MSPLVVASCTGSLTGSLLDLVLPRHCVGCGEPGAGLCAGCRSSSHPIESCLDGLPVVAARHYDGPVRRALLAYKERGRRDLATPLAVLLAAALRIALRSVAVPTGEPIIVGVPSTRAASSRRGGDHVARLARRTAPYVGVRMSAGILRLGRAVEDSAGLSADERAGNLAGAMHARAAPPTAAGRSVILVDDIVSSGSTLREAHRALDTAGWHVCAAAAVTATPARTANAGLVWSEP